MTKSADRKPDEYRKFEALAKKLIAVPKVELDKKVARYNAAKERRQNCDKQD
jgi:hypothetical protein